MLYFAYGSNLNVQQMRARCPKAVPLGNFFLGNSKLVFRGVADCMYYPGSVCPGGLWTITQDCVEALDRYEGFKQDAPSKGLYCKEYIEILNEDGDVSCEVMTYRMNSTGIFPPSQAYLDCIVQGYRDFRLPIKRLRRAVKRSYDMKNPSERELRRHDKKGRPQLAAVV